MKSLKIILILLLGTVATLSAQNREKAKALIEEGVELHDEGKYDKALKKYNQALDADAENIVALAEISLTYMAKQDYKSAIKYCKRAISKHPEDEHLADVYVNYGTCLDILGKSKKGVAIYDEGLQKFPSYYLLHFNKGVSQIGLKDYEGGIKSFQKAVNYNPEHGSSHFYLALIEADMGNKIPALLALSRFLTVEPTEERSKKARVLFDKLFNVPTSVNEEGKTVYNITLSDLSGDNENEFAGMELMFTLATSVIGDDFMKAVDSLGIEDNEVNRFKFKYDFFINSLTGVKDDKKGFYSKYYTPFLAEMKEKEHVETFAYIMFLYANDNDYVKTWFEENPDKLKAFSEWAANYDWDDW